MNGTEFSRISGSYLTAYIGTWQLLSQNIAENYSTIRLYGYFYYGGGTSVGSDDSNFTLHYSTIKTGSYRYYPGYTLLGQVDINVYHNSDGSFPSTSIGISASSYHMSGSTVGYITGIPTIPRAATIAKANDFNSNANPYLEYNNPGGFKINLRLEFGGVNIQRGPFYSTTGKYTFELTEEERQLLYSKATTNKLTVRYVIGTCIGSENETHWNWIDKIMTIVNSNPNFEYFEFEDVNATTLALTGNNQSIIKGYSNVKVSVPIENKAEAINGATMVKYRAEIGTATPQEFNYSDSADVSAIVTGANSATVKCYAIDSRNNSKSLENTAYTFVDYSAIEKGTIDINRQNGVSEEITLKFDGKYSNVNFGAKQNSIISAQYRYSVANKNEWSEWEYLEVTQGSGNFSFEGTIKGDTETLGFDVGNSYDIEVIVHDELSSVSYADTFGSGIPNIALHKNGVGIMGKYDVDIGGPLQVQGKDILKKDWAYLRWNRQSVSVSTAWAANTFGTVGNELSSGNFTTSGSNIVVGSGISKVKITAGCAGFNRLQATGDVGIDIYVDNKNVATVYYSSAYGSYSGGGDGTLVINVSEGSNIKVTFGSGFTGTIEHLGAWLLVEKLA